MMKRTVAIALCLSAAGCGSSDSEKNVADASPGAADATAPSTPDAAVSVADAMPDVDFLTDGVRTLVLNAINEECVFQSCDGDFQWDALDVRCSTNEEACSITFWTIPYDFVGAFDEAKATAAIGMLFSGDDGNGPYEGRYVDHFLDEDGRVLESVCTLEGYSAESALHDGSALVTNFESHILDCVSAITSGMFDLLAD